MISKKILYSEQLLQLVLALSLLQVDPINYLEWGVSRIHSDDGSPWQLEIAPTLFSDYPYMNRKTYIPFNEESGRFSHIHNYGVQTYLLNLSDDPLHNNHDLASRFIENSTNIINNNNNRTASDNATNTIVPAPATSTTTSASLINLIQESGSSGNLEDPFLHADILSPGAVEESIAEQNLADLYDYEEIVEPSSLFVPTKNEISSPTAAAAAEQQDVWHEFRGLRRPESAERNSTQAHANRMSVIELNLNDTSFTRSAIIDWDDDFLPFVNDSAAERRLKTSETDDEQRRRRRRQQQEKKTDDVGDDDEDRNNNEPMITSSVELTVEEMDLIEVLWKQDVDLGYNPSLSVTTNADATASQKSDSIQAEDDVEKLKALLELKSDKKSDDKEVDNDSDSPWPNLAYTIDTETGEYIFSPSGNNNSELENLLFDDNLQLVDANDISDKAKENDAESDESGEAKGEEKADDLEAILENNLDFEPGKEDDFLEDLNSSLSILLDEAENLDLLGDMMLQPPSSHPFQHPRQPAAQNYAHCVNSYRQSGYQGRVPLGRTMSMEQRWQDLANLLSFPPAMGMTDMGSHAAAVHYSPHYPYQTSGPMSHGQHSQFAHPHSHSVLHNASLAEIAAQPTSSHHLQPYSSNLGSAVATSMHLTSNSTSETDAGNSAYKMEHDLMYYSQQTEMNHPSDGILNIFNDEDLQLMDMAVNEGMYTMRMLDQNSNCTNSSALASNPHFNNSLLGSHMPTNLSSGIGSVASTLSTQQQQQQQHAASGDRLDASSDSAVSSMGSERVASLSDGEWNEAGSDSAQEYHSRKLVGPYDYRFNNNRMLDANRQPVAQKKHQMYGKRFAHEAAILPPPPLSHTNSSSTDSIPNIPIKYEPYDAYNASVAQASSSAAAAAASVIKPPPSSLATAADAETKYSYAIDFPHPRHAKSANGIASHELVHHNHTYTMPPLPNPQQQMPNSNGANPKPQMRDKKSKRSEEEHLTRDEKRARALQIPITVQDIINLPMDEFNERLSKYDLSENQLSLIRDIRRRGKNKVAAQNCRKRKLDQIISLADEVKDMKMRKDRFLREREMLLTERRRIKDKFAALYRHVFTNLRDPDGNPYSSYQYSLQQSADGSVVLVPRSDQNSTENAAANGNGSSQRNSNSQHGSNNNTSNFK